MFWSHTAPSIETQAFRLQITKLSMSNFANIARIDFYGLPLARRYIWPGGILQKNLLSYLTEFFPT